MHLHLIGASATQPNTGAAAAAVTGDSLVVANGKGDIKIIAAWADNQTAGWFQIAAPTGHDTSRGFRAVTSAGDPRNVLTPGLGLPVSAQETLAVQIAGSNTAGDVETVAMLLAYDNLPGIDAKMIKWAELVRRMEKITTIQATLTHAAAGHSGSELITAESDLLKANRQYAVLGANCSVETCALTLIGPDTGNVRIGVPGNKLAANHGVEFFPHLARAFDAAYIPVINSGNKGSTYLGTLGDENAASVVASWHLALLKN